MSSRHARIDWSGTEFGVTDQSLNGTDLNGRRLERAERSPLRDGDEIGIGPFRMQVSDPGAGAPEPRPVPVADPATSRAAPAASRAAPSDRFTLSLDELIGPEAPPERTPPPRVLPTFGAVPPTAVIDDFPTSRVVRVPPAAPPPPLPAEEAEPHWLSGADSPTADAEILLAAFWRGLGIGAPNAPTPAMMEEIGLTLHESLVGVGAMPTTQGHENPLANGVRDIRRHLNEPQLRLAEHVRAVFAAGQARAVAVQAAVSRAANGLADTLSARAIEERLDKAVRPRMPVFRRAELWRQFRALETEIRDAALHRFHRDLGERLPEARRLLVDGKRGEGE